MNQKCPTVGGTCIMCSVFHHPSFSFNPTAGLKTFTAQLVKSKYLT